MLICVDCQLFFADNCCIADEITKKNLNFFWTSSSDNGASKSWPFLSIVQLNHEVTFFKVGKRILLGKRAPINDSN